MRVERVNHVYYEIYYSLPSSHESARDRDLLDYEEPAVREGSLEH